MGKLAKVGKVEKVGKVAKIPQINTTSGWYRMFIDQWLLHEWAARHELPVRSSSQEAYGWSAVIQQDRGWNKQTAKMIG